MYRLLVFYYWNPVGGFFFGLFRVPGRPPGGTGKNRKELFGPLKLEQDGLFAHNWRPQCKLQARFARAADKTVFGMMYDQATDLQKVAN